MRNTIFHTLSEVLSFCGHEIAVLTNWSNMWGEPLHPSDSSLQSLYPTVVLLSYQTPTVNNKVLYMLQTGPHMTQLKLSTKRTYHDQPIKHPYQILNLKISINELVNVYARVYIQIKKIHSLRWSIDQRIFVSSFFRKFVLILNLN